MCRCLNYEQKRNSLLKSIHVAARKIAEDYFECNTEDIEGKDLLADGRVSPKWLDDGYGDQVSESLYGDTQADDIEPDDELFSEEDYIGKYGQRNMWNLLDKYFDDGEIALIFDEEWNNLMKEKYGENWSDLK